MDRRLNVLILVFVVIVGVLSVHTIGTIEDDAKDCADELTNLAACIPYVSGTAAKPTQQCCDDTKKVKADKPKCLCVLIKESADPSMGLPVNTTLALQMPSACNIDASVSDCPTLLKLAPGSPDAKIFKDASAGSSTATPAKSTTTTTTTPSSDSDSSSSTSDSTSGSKAAPASNNGGKLKLFEKASVFVLIATIAWIVLV